VLKEGLINSRFDPQTSKTLGIRLGQCLELRINPILLNTKQMDMKHA